MKKIAIMIIALMLITIGCLSGCNEQQSAEISNKIPIVSCSGNPTTGNAPLTVSFVGTGIDSDGQVISYHWNFGDGEQSSLQNPTHTFQNNGIYTVILTVTDDKEETATDSIQIIVSKLQNEQPTALASASTTSGSAPLMVSFTGFGTDLDGYIISYHWDFGDDYTSNQQNTSHTFTDEGTYTVTLTVTDNESGTGSDKVTIIVNPHQLEWIKVAEFIGTSDKVTDTFTTHGDKFKVIYSMTSSSYPYGAWYVFIYPEGQTVGSIFHASVSIRDYGQPSVTETSYAYEGAGTYYCNVGASNMASWSITIYDWK